MSRVAFYLPDAVSQRLQKLAARTGRSETEYMIEAIREYLDDLEDGHIAEQRLKEIQEGRAQTVPLEKVMKDCESAHTPEEKPHDKIWHHGHAPASPNGFAR